jgi:uncharacterized protein YjiS (DUF1127 family)
MNDYALHQAQTAGSLPGVGIIARLIRNWRARRSVRRLQDLDDYMLHDIGATREDVTWAARHPLSVNAALLLEERQRERTTYRHVL